MDKNGGKVKFNIKNTHDKAVIHLHTVVTARTTPDNAHQ